MTYPKQILFEKWADIGFNWQGDVPLETFDRLSSHLDAVAQKDTPTLAINIALLKKNGTVWLDSTIQGALWIACDRCLKPINKKIDDQYRIAIVRHDSEIPMLTQLGADYVHHEEVIQNGRWLPVFDMIEDELILSLPLAITHEECSMMAQTTSDIVDPPKENPFAILAELNLKT